MGFTDLTVAALPIRPVSPVSLLSLSYHNPGALRLTICSLHIGHTMGPPAAPTAGDDPIKTPPELSPYAVDSENVEFSDTVLADGEMLLPIGIVRDLAAAGNGDFPGPSTLRPMPFAFGDFGTGLLRALAAADSGGATSLGWSIIRGCKIYKEGCI